MTNSCCKFFLRDFEFKTVYNTIISNIYKVFTSEWKKFAALKYLFCSILRFALFLGLYELQYQVENNSMVIKTNSDYIESNHPNLVAKETTESNRLDHVAEETTESNPPDLVDECLNYEILNDPRRHYTKDKSGKYLCDNVNHPYKNNWKGRNFYRVMAPAGSKIKGGCVAGTSACGTYGQGYITVGTHPTLLNQRAKMTVCFKYGGVCPQSFCHREVEIEAINCGSYYVYDLPNLAHCPYAYCTE